MGVWAATGTWAAIAGLSQMAGLCIWFQGEGEGVVRVCERAKSRYVATQLSNQLPVIFFLHRFFATHSIPPLTALGLSACFR